jgi:two-component system, sensor histidine kinase and response regulator
MSSSPPPSILVVDDTPANLQLLVELLSERGYRVRPVPSGELALRAVQASKPDLVLLDINMPGLSGYDVCRRLKSDATTYDIPVIFLSALNEPSVKVLAFQCGGVDYVTKPFQVDEIAARVNTHLEIRNQRARLHEQNQKLREAEDLRDSLVHMVVHDMRSPLLGISLNLELLSETPEFSPDTRKMISDARLCTQTLIAMAEQMLDVSRLENGSMPLDRAPVDLGSLVSDALLGARPAAGARTLVQLGGLGMRATCDAALIRRVVGNLVSNAIKFTRTEGNISVRVVNEGGALRVEVQDDGVGIPKQAQGRIFEKFGQASATDARRGHGLGLAFVRMAVEAHQGAVGVWSESGKGSTFWFTLPVSGEGGS